MSRPDRHSRPRTALSILLAGGLLLQPPALEAQGVDAPPGSYAFVGVDVLPMTEDGMEGDGVRRNQTVVVQGDRITEVGPAGEVEIPANATRIDGEGRFLMPGLAEMHAHVPPVQTGRPDQEALEDILFLYVANGITTIRGMLGPPYQIDLRDELLSQETLGPAFYAAAPSINGNSAPTPEAAEAMLRDAAERGYDLMKIHPGVSRETWDHMVGGTSPPRWGSSTPSKRGSLPSITWTAIWRLRWTTPPGPLPSGATTSPSTTWSGTWTRGG